MIRSKNFLFYVLLIVLLLALSEITAYATLKIYINTRPDRINTNAYNSDIRKETAYTSKNARFSTHRGYMPLPNFRGKHVITDKLGFRIDDRNITKEPKIGVFGGSTVFSIGTSQETTIPNQIQIDGYQALNFGVGGYSSKAELSAFIEAIRSYPAIKIAVFYHGVNELYNYREITNASEQLMGGVFRDQLHTAMGNYAKPSLSILDSNVYYVIKKLLTIKKSRQFFTNADTELTNIKNIYFDNIKVIQGIAREHDIKTIFILQPSVYTTDFIKLGAEEKIVSESGYAKNLYPQLVQEILSDERSKNFTMTDFSEVLNEKEDTVFLDSHHLNDYGNKIVGSNMTRLVKNKVIQ